MKSEKYEQLLDESNKADLKIDVETLDGRINFLVNILEEYRRILEEDSAFNDPEGTPITLEKESSFSKHNKSNPTIDDKFLMLNTLSSEEKQGDDL